MSDCVKACRWNATGLEKLQLSTLGKSRPPRRMAPAINAGNSPRVAQILGLRRGNLLCSAIKIGSMVIACYAPVTESLRSARIAHDRTSVALKGCVPADSYGSGPYGYVYHVPLSESTKQKRWECSLEGVQISVSMCMQVIKDGMDKKFGAAWHCIAGQSFSYGISNEVSSLHSVRSPPEL